MCADVQRLPPTGEQVVEAVTTLAMLVDATRILLLWALMDGELAVHDLASVAGCSATSASQHLAKLRLAGVVRQRREGRHVFYRAEDIHMRRLLLEALHHADHAVQNRPDHT